jgi:hypothetical protein
MLDKYFLARRVTACLDRVESSISEYIDMNTKLAERLGILICMLVISAYILPYFILGEDAHLRVHDNLDSNFVWYKLLVNGDLFFASNNFPVTALMDGLPRGSLPSEFDFFSWVMAIFDPYYAYTVNRIFISIVGFVGMWLLLSRHFSDTGRNRLIAFGVAAHFATISHWAMGGLTVAGMPILIYGFLNSLKGHMCWKDLLIATLIPLYSSFVWGGAFLICVFFGWYLVEEIRHKGRLSKHPIIYIGLVLLVYCVANYRLIIAIAFPEFISHRVEFVDSSPASLIEVVKQVGALGLLGHYASPSNQFPLVILVCGVIFLVVLKNKSIPRRAWFLGLISFLIVSTVWYGLYYWQGFSSVKTLFFSLIPIQLQRFHFIHPIVFGVLFYLSLDLISDRVRWGKILAVTLIITQLVVNFGYHELLANRKNPSFKAFFAQSQFEQILTYINSAELSDKRVASVGIHPAIAQFNGFDTIDGYFVNYPLAYKERFREVVAPELLKNEEMRKYFDDWGSRAYLFSSELWSSYGENKFSVSKTVQSLPPNKIVLEEFTVNSNALRELGAGFILSAIEIIEPEGSGLNFEKVFTHKESAWDIYLYSVAQ